ncbi:hypothetical protein TNCV_613521 [Trichonephila clavipes]|nr:hypothetical protein TNCV_613521 [Trichonephila clavipes]
MSNGIRNSEWAFCPSLRILKGFSAIRIQVLVPHRETHLVLPFGTPAPASSFLERGVYYRSALSNIVTQVSKMPQGTTFGSSKPASSDAGKGHYDRPAVSGKVTGIFNIRFRILVHYPKNDHKCTFPSQEFWGKLLSRFA